MLLTVGGAEWVAAQVATPPPARREPQRSLENEHPPLFFREDWKLDPNAPNVNNEREPEHPIVQGDVANPNLEVRLYSDRAGTRISGFHYLRPIVKLASGQWLVGDKFSAGPATSWAETQIQLIDVRWRNLNMETVTEARDGYWVDWPDLTNVEEIGFTDLMRGSGHGSGGGSRLDWIEVYGKPVPRAASSPTTTSR